MVAIKKQKIEAYILLESLLALSIFSLIVTLFLQQVNLNRKQTAKLLAEQEVLLVAKMAVQTQQDSLTLNGITVEVKEGNGSMTILHAGEEILHVAQKN